MADLSFRGRQPPKRPTTSGSPASAPLEPNALAAYRAAVEAALEVEGRDAARVAELLGTATPWSQ